MSDSLWLHGLQYARLPCPSLSPEVCSNSYPLNQSCYQPSQHLPPSSPFTFSLSQHQGLFQEVDSLHPGGQSIGDSASASVLPMNIQGWFHLGLTGWISLFMGLSRVFSIITIWKHQFFSAQSFLWSNSHICTWLLEKPKLWLCRPWLAKWCLCFFICYLGFSRSKHLLSIRVF